MRSRLPIFFFFREPVSASFRQMWHIPPHLPYSFVSAALFNRPVRRIVLIAHARPSPSRFLYFSPFFPLAVEYLAFAASSLTAQVVLFEPRGLLRM